MFADMLADEHGLVSREIHHYAGSHSFILCTRGPDPTAINEMGSIIGNRTRHDVGRDLKRRPSGSGISGIRKCGEAKITKRNGSMFSEIQLEPAWLNNLKIGHFKAR